MARNQFPVMKSGSGLLAKLVGVVVGLAVLALIINHPSDAAGWVRGAWHLAGSVVDGLSTFLQKLAG